jgi:hypothetical protein
VNLWRISVKCQTRMLTGEQRHGQFLNTKNMVVTPPRPNLLSLWIWPLLTSCFRDRIRSDDCVVSRTSLKFMTQLSENQCQPCFQERQKGRPLYIDLAGTNPNGKQQPLTSVRAYFNIDPPS